jgi:GNAT superfamily N-acetyltransferase
MKKSMKATSDEPDVKFESLTRKNWKMFETLMGERGGCGGCWCMAFRVPRKEFDEQKYDGNKNAMKEIVARKEPVGLIASVDGEPIGWIALAPREVYWRIEHSRSLKRIDDKPVWSITCFFVKKEYRRTGVSNILIRGAVEYAEQHDITMLEAYPTIPYSEKIPDAFLWTGSLSVFVRNGFTVVQRNGKSRAIVRREIVPMRL